MRRPLALIPILFLVPVAACAAPTNDPAAPAPAATTAATRARSTPARTTPARTAPARTTPASAKPASARPAAADASLTAKAAGSANPAFGTQYAVLKSSKVGTRQITYDLIGWYEGEQATRACAEDGVKPAENDYCSGWYIRNNNTKLRTLTVDPDASIRVVVNGTLKTTDLTTFLDQVGPRPVIRFDVDANRIVKLDQIYLP